MNEDFSSLLIDRCVKMIIRPPRTNFCRESWTGYYFKQFKANDKLNMKIEVVEIPNIYDDKVYSTLFEPKEKAANKPIIIFSHGNGCDISFTESELLDIFIPRGISVLLFTFPGCGDSDPDYITFGIKESDTVLDLVEFARSRGFERIGLWGHSMGAFSTLLAIENDNDITAAVLDAPFTSIKDVACFWFKKYAEDECSLEKLYEKVKKEVFEKIGFDLDDGDAIPKLGEIKCPVMVFHCTSDDIIPAEMSQIIQEKLGKLCTRITIKDGDHVYRPLYITPQLGTFMVEKLLE